MFDLGKWRIQLPVNGSGGFSGDMRIVNPAKTVAPWFIAYPDRLEFTCPAKGATSPSSPSPRTELAENNTWYMERGGTMAAVVTVHAVPSNLVTIGQVWNKDPALLLRVNGDGYIIATTRWLPDTWVANVPLGTPFSYYVGVNSDRVLWLDINGVTVWWRDMTPWVGRKMYFKAGTYTHATPGTDPNALYKATFTYLKIAH
jgi:hypothetical protein